MHRASSYNMYINQQDAQNPMIRLYFPLDALHVSDYISPSSGATFISCASHLVYAGTIRLASHTRIIYLRILKLYKLTDILILPALFRKFLGKFKRHRRTK